MSRRLRTRDVVALAVERDADTITFRVRFAAGPPLGVSLQDGWVDMILIGIDVPPFGAPPVTPGYLPIRPAPRAR